MRGRSQDSGRPRHRRTRSRSSGHKRRFSGEYSVDAPRHRRDEVDEPPRRSHRTYRRRSRSRENGGGGRHRRRSYSRGPGGGREENEFTPKRSRFDQQEHGSGRGNKGDDGHHHRHHNTTPRRPERVVEPLASFEQWVRTDDPSLNGPTSTPESRYQEYSDQWEQRRQSYFVQDHEDEDWFKDRYSYERLVEHKLKRSDRNRNSAREFVKNIVEDVHATAPVLEADDKYAETLISFRDPRNRRMMHNAPYTVISPDFDDARMVYLPKVPAAVSRSLLTKTLQEKCDAVVKRLGRKKDSDTQGRGVDSEREEGDGEKQQTDGEKKLTDGEGAEENDDKAGQGEEGTPTNPEEAGNNNTKGGEIQLFLSDPCQHKRNDGSFARAGWVLFPTEEIALEVRADTPLVVELPNEEYGSDAEEEDDADKSGERAEDGSRKRRRPSPTGRVVRLIMDKKTRYPNRMCHLEASTPERVAVDLNQATKLARVLDHNEGIGVAIDAEELGQLCKDTGMEKDATLKQGTGAMTDQDASSDGAKAEDAKGEDGAGKVENDAAKGTGDGTTASDNPEITPTPRLEDCGIQHILNCDAVKTHLEEVSATDVESAKAYAAACRKLDIVLGYLRKVHLVCYYSFALFRDEGAMIQASSAPYIRQPLGLAPSLKQEEGDEKKTRLQTLERVLASDNMQALNLRENSRWMGQLAQGIENLMASQSPSAMAKRAKQRVEDGLRLEKLKADAVQSFCKQNTKPEKGNFRCLLPPCKLFKSEEFVAKHIHNKHKTRLVLVEKMASKSMASEIYKREAKEQAIAEMSGVVSGGRRGGAYGNRGGPDGGARQGRGGAGFGGGPGYAKPLMPFPRPALMGVHQHPSVPGGVVPLHAPLLEPTPRPPVLGGAPPGHGLPQVAAAPPQQQWAGGRRYTDYDAPAEPQKVEIQYRTKVDYSDL